MSKRINISVRETTYATYNKIKHNVKISHIFCDAIDLIFENYSAYKKDVRSKYIEEMRANKALILRNTNIKKALTLIEQREELKIQYLRTFSQVNIKELLKYKV